MKILQIKKFKKLNNIQKIKEILKSSEYSLTVSEPNIEEQVNGSKMI